MEEGVFVNIQCAKADCNEIALRRTVMGVGSHDIPWTCTITTDVSLDHCPREFATAGSSERIQNCPVPSNAPIASTPTAPTAAPDIVDTRPQAAPVDEGTANFRSLEPVLSVPIPGVNFSPATLSNGEVTVPFLAQYILGIYRFAIGAAAILASIMVVYGGFRYLLGSTLGDVKEGKTVIQNAVIGLVVLLCSYVILRSVNPDLVTLKALKLSYIVRDAAGENSWNGQGGSYTSASGDGSCPQGGQITTQALDGRGTFSIIPLPKEYKMFQGVWKDIAYGPELPSGQSPYPCRCGCQQNRTPGETCPNMGQNNACPDHGTSTGGNHAYSAQENMCIGTIGQGGCGPTSFAIAMAYYGVNISDTGANQLADAAKFWKRGPDATANSSPDHAVSNNGWILTSAHENGESGARLESDLRARAQPHLYDPLDGAKDAVRFGGRVINVGTSTGFMNRAANEHQLRALDIPGGSGRAAAVGEHIRQGHPVIFKCRNCILNIGSGSQTDTYSGHYMVIHGANAENTSFLVSDVGTGQSAKRYISADELNGSNVPEALAITPQNGGTGQCRGNGQTSAGASSDSITGSTAPVTAGGITMSHFDYRPSGGQGWNANQSTVLFPERLTREFAAAGSSGGARPRLRAYVFIHGGPGGAQATPERSAYISRMRNALQSVAGSKNIVMLMPHYFGQGTHDDPRGTIDPDTGRVRKVPIVPFMNRFNLTDFYNSAIAAAVAAIPGSRPDDFVDVVVGGHSASNCDGQVNQAIEHPLPHQRGVVYYDGCLGYSVVTPARVPLPTVGDAKGSIYFNPDQGGMGRGHGESVQTGWGLRQVECSSFVTGITRTECYSHVIGGEGLAHREVISYETHLNHGDSVLPMTKFMFNAFYGNDH